MHRHYKELPPSSRCLEFLRDVDVIHIGYIVLSTFYAVPLSVGSRWQGDVVFALPDVSLHDPHSFIINHPHLSVVTVFFKLTSLSKAQQIKIAVQQFADKFR